MKRQRLLLLAALALGSPVSVAAQGPRFTRADSVRGSITPERAWWDVVHYDLSVRVNPSDSSIEGSNTIRYNVIGPSREMQIDLMAPLEVDSVVQDGTRLSVRRDGNAFFVLPQAPQALNSRRQLTVHYHGRPRVAVNAPWDGGIVWARDPQGKPWVATANQGIGASVWWPNKDHQSDEPDSLRIRMTVPASMVEVSNGRLRSVERHEDETATYEWAVVSPINNYGVTINAGNYVHFGERMDGEAGTLDLDYWVLEPHLAQARAQFAQVEPMMSCFEGWFGPYPFYEDGFKLVEAPYLGMEHQSAVAYGNRFQNGYLGSDLSGTGRGLSWDYVIIHESAHEWFGNSITTADVADLWVHEGFADYAESLYVECTQGEEAGAEYVLGSRTRILNDRPMIGPYGVHREGSGDMYFKGANVLHTLRQIVDDAGTWRGMLRGMNEAFRHKTVTSREVEEYLGQRTGRDLSRFFDQYLRRAQIPILEYAVEGDTLWYRWRADVEGFDMPVKVTVSRGSSAWIYPETGNWTALPVDLGDPRDFRVDENFYVRAVEVRR